MRDLERERLALRGMGAVGRAEHEAERARRDAEDREHAARTCLYCFHDRHEVPWVGGGVTVLYCGAAACVCGVPPCADCESRVRADSGDPGRERCAACGAAWQGAPVG